jgi:hypothetical protein
MVDLPEPLSPTRPKVSPSRMSKLTLLTARKYLPPGREDRAFGLETHLEIADPDQRSVDFLVAPGLAEPVRGDVDFLLRRAGLFDVVHHGKRSTLMSGRGTAEIRLCV